MSGMTWGLKASKAVKSTGKFGTLKFGHLDSVLELSQYANHIPELICTELHDKAA